MGFSDTVLGGTIDYQIERYDGAAWEDTGWGDRIFNIGQLSRGLGANWQGEFQAGQWSCRLADTDQVIWGSLTSLINHKLRFSVRIDGGAWNNQFTGRVTEEQIEKSVFSLTLIDFFQDIKDSHFEWDYASLNTHVDGVEGTEISFDTAAESMFRGSFCNGGTEGTGGQIVKFSLGDYSYPVQSAIANETAFLVKAATWANNEGVIRLSASPTDIGSGWYSYIRRDLVFSGNPGQVIYDILTGTNTNLQWSDSDFDKTLWGAGTDSTILFDFGGTIQGDETPEPGQVLQEIKDICQSSLSDIWFSASGEFSWGAWRPRFPEDLYHFREGSQIKNLGWNNSIEDIYTRIEVRYNFQSAGESYGAVVSRTFPETATHFNFLDRTGTIETKWISNIDEAAVVRDRMGIRYKKGIPKISFQSSLFAMVGTLDSLINITTRSGSLATSPFQIRELKKDFQKSVIGVEADDAVKLYRYKGFARWEDGSVDGDGVPNDTDGSTMVGGLAPGTSRSGWCWFNSPGNRIATTTATQIYPAGDVMTFTPVDTFQVGDYVTVPPDRGNNWEIIRGSVLLSAGTMYVTRGVESTFRPGTGTTWGSASAIYMAGSQMPPMQWLSGKIQGTNAGTVRNMNPDYGTVFRWF